MALTGVWINAQLQADNALISSWRERLLPPLLVGGRHAQVATFLVVNLFASGAARGWLLLGGMLALVRGQPADRLAGAMVALAMFAYYAVFVAAPHDLDWHLSTAAVRVFAHIGPVAACLGVRAIASGTGARLT